MPKKKSKPKDSKKTNAPETTEYQLITLEENHAYQIKHENLIQRVWKSALLFEDVELAVKEKANIENNIKEWKTYLKCDKIPKPFEPQKIRNFFDKSLHYEIEDIQNTINWMLDIDERSILNQDIESINKTKTNLKLDRSDFGQQYDIRICDTMELLKRIQEFLESPIKNIPKETLLDIEGLYQSAKSKICCYIDNLTYRVLYSEAAYMESINVISAEYFYQGQHFDIHLWTFQNVPIYLDPEETKSITIQLKQIKTELIIPFCVLSENMVIRGLYCHFDYLSSLARYNEMPIKDETVISLKIALQKEWAGQKKIQAEIKANMIKERSDFEEAMRLKAEEEELKAKEAKKDDKSKKAPKKKENSAIPKKLPKEPPIITPDLVPIVRKDFLEHDAQEYANSIILFHPNKLNLSNGEVNLRQYQILGGVYHINSLTKPNVANIPKLIMTWYKSEKHFETKKTQVYSDVSNADDISKFFEITFELPDCFCHSSEPIVCIFEEHQSQVNDSLYETEKALKIGSPVIINDFNLHDLFTKPMMYNFLENCNPRIISTFKFPEDFHNEDEDKKSKSTLGRSKEKAENEEKNKEHELQKQFLSFDMQRNPERLFPLFKNVLPVVILPIDEDKVNRGTQPYEYFSEFMSTLESIKDSYRKSSFKDKFGNPVKILAEEYEKNIRRPRITTKLVAYEKAKEIEPTKRASLHINGRDSVGSRQSLEHRTSLKKEQLSVKSNEPLKNKTKKPQKVKTPESIPDLKEDSHLSHLETEERRHEEQSISKWSTTNILKTVFNPNEKKITIWTDRLGTFGLAFNRYQHFPFKSWSLQRNDEKANELELKIESKYALFRIYITGDGYKALITDFSKTLKSRKIFLDIDEPISDLRIFKKKLQDTFLNIFSEPDTVWYVNGNFSEKHLAAELHTYDSISLNVSNIKFHSSDWNKLSKRRTMVLKLGELKELDQDLCLIQITPEGVMFVEINEVKTDMGVTELEYVSTWRNLEWYADLNHLIKSNFGDISDSTFMNEHKQIILYLRNLLHSIRLLSFS
ncbi:uncharacterized protein LOC129918712 [Episyrphus balteatus]|uniref:uncharacterized protein LOC129918712 n=1 Tax=Episyrphus balteatus TaxID=286459 RepID=UPI0024853C9B|nr:uncharacterized protein LOC129918712 [Episyrphus balteatus]